MEKSKKQWDDIVLNAFWRISDCAGYGKTIMVKAGILKNAVQRVHWVYDKKSEIVYQDSIREYRTDGTIRSFDIPEEQRDTINLRTPFRYYEYDDGRGFVTLIPFEGIIDCIKSCGCINWSSESNKMALINWGHSYMLSGETIKAIKIYQLFPSDFSFGKDFEHMTYEQVLKNDWNDFVKSQLISKDKVEKMLNLIITKKN